MSNHICLQVYKYITYVFTNNYYLFRAYNNFVDLFWRLIYIVGKILQIFSYYILNYLINYYMIQRKHIRINISRMYINEKLYIIY